MLFRSVFGIFTSRSMRERGIYQLQMMKTRSSSGVGQKIELAFNIESLRIYDPNPDDPDNQRFKNNTLPSANEIMNKLKPQSTVTTENIEISEETKRVVADVQGSKLKSLLNNLKK